MLVLSCVEQPAATRMDAQVTAGAAAGSACSNDAECPGGFCDLGACAVEYFSRRYGFRCDETALPTDPLVASKFRACGGYVCSEGRCRSCLADTQCLGGAICQRWPSDDVPGMACGTVR
jgi:hypothetical protein